MPDTITIKPVETHQDKLVFIAVPRDLYARMRGFVPQLIYDELKFLEERRNPLLSSNESGFFLAERDGKVVGRVSAHTNKAYEKTYGMDTGFLGYIDAIDDVYVVKKLIDTARMWLLERHKTRMEGPYQFSINQICGLQVDGHGQNPMVKTGFAPPYLGGLLEKVGLKGIKDLECFQHSTGDSRAWLDRYERLLDGWKEKERLCVIPLSVKEQKEKLSLLTKLYNESYRDNWHAVPVSLDEARFVRDLMRPVIFNGWTVMAEWYGKPAGLLSQIPNVDEAIHDMNGQLNIFSLMKLAKRLYMGGVQSSRVPIIAVHPALRGTKAGAMVAGGLMASSLRSAMAKGIKTVEISWMLEDNYHILNLVKKMPSRFARRYRIYESQI